MRLSVQEIADLGEKIRAARKGAKMSQKELAEACFTVQSNISNYENGTVVFASPELLATMSRVLGVSLMPETPLEKFLRVFDERCAGHCDRGFWECYEIAVSTAKIIFSKGVVKR